MRIDPRMKVFEVELVEGGKVGRTFLYAMSLDIAEYKAMKLYGRTAVRVSLTGFTSLDDAQASLTNEGGEK